LRVSTFAAARTADYERDSPASPRSHTEQSGFGGKDTTSVFACVWRKMKGSPLPIDSPFEVDRKPSWVPGRFPDSRIIELEQPSQGFPQWRLLLQLSAFTVAGPCRIFTGFPIKREAHQTPFFYAFLPPLSSRKSRGCFWRWP